MLLDEESEAFEDGAVAEDLGVAEQGRVVAVVAGEVRGQTVRDVLAAAPDGRIVEEVDDGPVDVRKQVLYPA